jgi:hypothetical protein
MKKTMGIEMGMRAAVTIVVRKTSRRATEIVVGSPMH